MGNLGWRLFALNPVSPLIQPPLPTTGRKGKRNEHPYISQARFKAASAEFELCGCLGGFSETYPPQYYHICSKLQYQASPNKTRIHLDDKILVACGWTPFARSRSFSKSLGRREEIRSGPSGCVIMDVPCRILSIDNERRHP